MVQQWTTRGIKIEKFITQKSWKRYLLCSQDHKGRSRQGAGRKRGRSWGTCFIRVCVWSVLKFLVYGQIGQFKTKKSRVWSSARGFYLKGSIRRRPWEAGETVGEVLSVTHIFLWLQGLFSRPSTCTRRPSTCKRRPVLA